MKKNNMWYYFTIYLHHENSIEAFSFASSDPNKNYLNQIINKYDLVYRFIVYFMDRASIIIESANLYNIDVQKSDFLKINCPKLSKIEKEIKKFLKDTEISRYPIMTKNNETIYLTPRQAQCLYFLAKGRTQKEIGRHLHIGHKAVEAHLEKARLKTGCKSSYCLIGLFEKNNLDKVIFATGGQ